VKRTNTLEIHTRTAQRYVFTHHLNDIRALSNLGNLGVGDHSGPSKKPFIEYATIRNLSSLRTSAGKDFLAHRGKESQQYMVKKTAVKDHKRSFLLFFYIFF
jgi:hypothetical protein